VSLFKSELLFSFRKRIRLLFSVLRGMKFGTIYSSKFGTIYSRLLIYLILSWAGSTPTEVITKRCKPIVLHYIHLLIRSCVSAYLHVVIGSTSPEDGVVLYM